VQRGPHYLDVGFRVRAPAVLDEAGQPRDLSTATTTEILAKRPGGLEVNPAWQGQADTQAGVVVYETQAEDLDEPGTWQIQAHVVLEDGSEYHGPVGIMRVEGVLNGDVGIPEGVSSHAPRHHHDGPDPLVLQDASSGEADADLILVSDGDGGWTLEEQTGGLVDHAETHHHDGADPIDVEDLRSRYDDIRVLFTGVVDDFSEPAPNRVEGVPFFDIFIPALSFQLQDTLRPVRLVESIFNTNHTIADANYWRLRRNTATALRTATAPASLQVGHYTVFYQEGIGGTLAFAASGDMRFVEGGDLVTQSSVVLATGDVALFLVVATNRAVVLRLGNPRLEAATITASESFLPRHHNTQRRYVSGTDMAVTFDAARRGDFAVYDHMSSAGRLTFLEGTASIVVPPGQQAAISENGSVTARYVATNVVYLFGSLEDA
jgi:hypothetical protein